MTIAMIGHKGLPARSGGFERHVSFLAQGLALRGHRVISYGRRWYVGNESIGLPNGIEQYVTSGIHTKHLDAITHSFTALLHAYRIQPDILHLHGTGVSLLAPFARLFFRHSKIVVTFHCQDAVLVKWNWFAKFAFRFGEWCACHFAHRTVVVSQALARYCLKKYQCQVAYITHPFIPPTSLPPVEGLSREDLKAKQYLLSVSRLIPDKQIHVLIEAYAMARNAAPSLFKDIPLVIVGGGAWTDTYVRRIKQLVAQTPGVRLLGERCGNELETLQAHALAHVFPTSSEGLSFSMLEAAAFARPAVITNLPQNREATGEFALEVRPEDAADLARGLHEIMTMPTDERERIGVKMHEHLKKQFSFNDRVDDVALLYHELCTGDMSLRTRHALLEYSLR